MGQHVFFLNRLRPEIQRTDYERWVREVDYPRARSRPITASYRVIRIDGALRGGEVPYDYIETLEVPDVAEYLAAIERSPGREQLVKELRGYVGGVVAIHGSLVE